MLNIIFLWGMLLMYFCNITVSWLLVNYWNCFAARGLKKKLKLIANHKNVLNYCTYSIWCRALGSDILACTQSQDKVAISIIISDYLITMAPVRGWDILGIRWTNSSWCWCWENGVWLTLTRAKSWWWCWLRPLSTTGTISGQSIRSRLWRSGKRWPDVCIIG